MSLDLPALPQFRDADVPGGAGLYDQLAHEIRSRLEAPWEHDDDAEGESFLRRHGDFRVFRRHGFDDVPGVRLFLVPRSGTNDIYVSNIVPEESGQLSIDEYNAALLDFVDRFLGPAAEALGLSVVVGPDVFDVRQELGDDVADALGAFSGAANRSTGSSHPMDEERWHRFLVLLHRSDRTWHATGLAQWLELDGWPSDTASELAIEFEAAMNLLDYAAEH